MKTNKLDNHNRQVLIDELLKQPDRVLATALVYAKNLVETGVDVAHVWSTAVQQNNAIEVAYTHGYWDGTREAVDSAKEFTGKASQELVDIDAVSRDKLIEWFENYIAIEKYYHPYSKKKNIPFDEIVRIIKEVPHTTPKQGTCKECQWWDKETHHCNKEKFDNTWKHDIINEDWDVTIHRRTRENFYCADFQKGSEE